MIVLFTKRFRKQLQQLPASARMRFDERLPLFIANPTGALLRNHAVRHPYLGFRSIDITGDIRALYEMVNEQTVLFSYIGTHSELYN